MVRYAAFHGRLMPRRDLSPVLIFDLDGTILQINSFPLWVLFLIGGRLSTLGTRRRLALSVRGQLALVRRKLRRTNHDGFLRELQVLWHEMSGSDGEILTDRFIVRLLSRTRTNLNSTLRWVQSGEADAILATAAAAEYAEGLGQRLGFRHVVATPANRRPGEPCNSGTSKRDRVFRLLAERDWESRALILFTDHADDLPLMWESSVVYWFGSSALLSQMEDAAPNAIFRSCLELDDKLICATLRADYAAAPSERAEQAAGLREMTAS